jgi:hypothetical protein
VPLATQPAAQLSTGTGNIPYNPTVEDAGTLNPTPLSPPSPHSSLIEPALDPSPALSIAASESPSPPDSSTIEPTPSSSAGASESSNAAVGLFLLALVHLLSISGSEKHENHQPIVSLCINIIRCQDIENLTRDQVFGAAAGPSGRSDAAQSKIHLIANTSSDISEQVYHPSVLLRRRLRKPRNEPVKSPSVRSTSG